MKKWLPIVALVLFFALLPQLAHATLLLDLTSGGLDSIIGTGRTLGWEFRVDSPVTIGGLGFWDSEADGLGATHTVRLWTSGATLLASTTVTNASSPVASAHPAGRWLTETLSSPVALTVGTYVVAADYVGGDPDHLRTTTSFTTAPEITYVRELGRSGTPGFPTNTFGLFDRYFGATLVTAVPEPSTLALFSLGFLGILGRDRHRGRKSRKRR